MQTRRLLAATGAALGAAALVAASTLTLTPTGDPIAVSTGPSYWSADYRRETRAVYPVYPGWPGITGHDPVGRLIKRNGTWLPNEPLAAWTAELGVTPAANPPARTAEDWLQRTSTGLGAHDHLGARSARLLFVALLAAAAGLLCAVLTWVFRKPRRADDHAEHDPI